MTRRDATFVRDVGTTQNGINVRMDGRVESRITSVGRLPISGRFRADGSAVGRIRLFGSNREAVAVTGFGEVGGSLQTFGASASYSGGYTVRLGGQTMFAPSFSGTANVVLAADRSFAVPIIQATSVSIPTPIGLSINLRVEAGANARLALRAALRPAELRAPLFGSATGVATGRASAAIGLLCASVGVETDLRLLDTALTPNLTASAAGLSGQLGYSVEAVRMIISVFANLCGLDFSTPVLNQAFGRVSGTRTLF